MFFVLLFLFFFYQPADYERTCHTLFYFYYSVGLGSAVGQKTINNCAFAKGGIFRSARGGLFRPPWRTSPFTYAFALKLVSGVHLRLVNLY